MRGALLMIVMFSLVGFYLVDKYQYDGHYASVVWKKANAQAQVFQDELRVRFGRH